MIIVKSTPQSKVCMEIFDKIEHINRIVFTDGKILDYDTISSLDNIDKSVIVIIFNSSEITSAPLSVINTLYKENFYTVCSDYVQDKASLIDIISCSIMIDMLMYSILNFEEIEFDFISDNNIIIEAVKFTSITTNRRCKVFSNIENYKEGTKVEIDSYLNFQGHLELISGISNNVTNISKIIIFDCEMTTKMTDDVKLDPKILYIVCIPGKKLENMHLLSKFHVISSQYYSTEIDIISLCSCLDIIFHNSPDVNFEIVTKSKIFAELSNKIKEQSSRRCKIIPY